MDIMDPKPSSKKKNVVTFEINDNHRTKHEIKGKEYAKPFKLFLQSLGYTLGAVDDYDSVELNGVKFQVHLDNASYGSYTPYGRTYSIRKPQNRFVSLKAAYLETTNIVKVFINQEMDADRIKSKIDAAIAAKKEKEQEFLRKIESDNQSLLAIGTHFLTKNLKRHCDSFTIEKGDIMFRFSKLPFSITIAPDGSLKNVHVSSFDLATKGEVGAYLSKTKFISDYMVALVKEITSQPTLPKELQEWAKAQHFRLFYTSTMSSEHEIQR